MNREPQKDYAIDVITGQKQKKTLNAILRNNRFTTIIVNAGYLQIVLKEVIIPLDIKDLFIVTGTQGSRVRRLSKQSEIWVLSFNPSYLYGTHLEKTAPAFLIFLISLGYSKITLKSSDLGLLIQWFKLLHSKKTKKHCPMYGHRILLRETQMLLCELREVYLNNTPEFLGDHQHKYMIVFQFLRHLELHFKTQHSVQFYADALYLSADYLSKVVKEVTRKTAKQSIEEKIMDTAKVLLFKNKGITAIGASLGFKTSSHFCYFFKKHTSLSPSLFRKAHYRINSGRAIHKYNMES